MRVGIVQFMAFPATTGGDGPVLESIERIAYDPFFESIEVTRIKDAATRARVARLLAESQMEVGFAAQPIQLGEKLDVGAADPAERRRAVERLRQAVAEAVEIGAPKLAVMSGPDPGPAGRAAAFERTVESLAEVCRAAQEAGIAVTLEVFDRGIDKRCLIGSTADAVRLSEALRREFPGFGIMLDLSHLPLQGEKPLEALQLARAHLTHVHIGNCVLKAGHPGYGDTHPPFGVPEGENGVAELAEFLRGLIDIGYLGAGRAPTVAFEVRPRAGDSTEFVLANAKRTLKAAWRAVSH